MRTRRLSSSLSTVGISRQVTLRPGWKHNPSKRYLGRRATGSSRANSQPVWLRSSPRILLAQTQTHHIQYTDTDTQAQRPRPSATRAQAPAPPELKPQRYPSRSSPTGARAPAPRQTSPQRTRARAPAHPEPQRHPSPSTSPPRPSPACHPARAPAIYLYHIVFFIYIRVHINCVSGP